jgi:hypothetical protein
MLWALLTVAVAQAPAPPKPSTADAPSATRLLFQAGDLRRAIAMAQACAAAKKKGHKDCAAMVKPLVEYQALVVKEQGMTAEEVRALLEYQQQISPQVPSKLTAPYVERFITRPWEQAQVAMRGGDEALARKFAEAVLRASPQHEGALALVYGPDAGRPDAGTRRDPRPETRDAGPGRRDGGRGLAPEK